MKTYYVHGKDNIPFHSVIWPAVLLGIGEEAIPRHIVSNEYLTVEKENYLQVKTGQYGCLTY